MRWVARNVVLGLLRIPRLWVVRVATLEHLVHLVQVGHTMGSFLLDVLEGSNEIR